MASRIKGITIEINGDPTGLQKALAGVDKSIENTQRELKDVERLLKIDPKNTELLAQKQQLLTKAIADTKDRLDALKKAEEQAQEQFKRGEMSREAYDRLKREIVATEQSEKNLTNQLKNTNAALQDQEGSMTKAVVAAELMHDVLVKVGKAVLDTAKSAVKYNAQMESYSAAFESFLGSAEEAQRAIANIKKDASTMPFGASELIEANKMLITAGESAEEARDNINALAAAVAATGGGNAELNRMAANLTQIKNTGKATAQDIKQFANAGINIFGLLSDYAEATGQDVNDLEYDYETLTAAIQMSTQEGGRYYGAMEKQAETYNGQLNSLKARIQDTLGTTFQSVSDTLRDKVFPAINRALDSIDFESLARSISNIVDLVASILPVVSFVVTNAIDLIGKMVGNFNPAIESIKAVLEGLIGFISNIFSGQWNKAWSSLGSALANMFAGVANALIGVVNTMIDALNKVISWITGNKATISKIPLIGVASTTTSSTKKNLPVVKKGNGESLMASGGIISHGSAIVGDNGPELLTMNGGIATVQPINNNTTNLGGINLSVYGAQGQSVNELADVIMYKIQTAVNQKGAVWA